ncbi:hypothetical protein M2138_000418 [Dysgonomonadaceae bacterium PH5-43]|nr:hypothetical protein [Dysgonomonadaceae bacterium PH5-43]
MNMNHLKKVLILLLIGFCSMEVSSQIVDQTCHNMYAQGEAEMKKGNYDAAISKFSAAADCASNVPDFVTKCVSMKKQCEAKKKGNATKSKKALSVSSSSASFDADGGTTEIAITGNNWTVNDVLSEWCNIEKKSSSIMVNVKPNTSIRSRSATIIISDGNVNKDITIIQGKADEFLRLSASDLSFVSRGNEEEIIIQTNTEWSYSNAPSWCTVQKNGNKLTIKADPNNSTKERSGSIIVNSNSLEKKIALSQNIGNETLSASKNSLSYSNLGGQETINIYTDSEGWAIGDFPKWCSVTKVNDYAILVECLENNTTKARSETIQIRTNKQMLGLKVSQERGYEATVIQPSHSSKVIRGRDVSWGITAGLVFPYVSSSASGEDLGSVVNYGYSDGAEKPSYKAEMGFTIGALIDFRLYNNLYLQMGLNYTNLKYKNSFSGNFFDDYQDGNYTYKGQAYDDFTENYNMSYLDIPIIFSYRFKLSEKTNLQLNLGPYISYGLSGKMKLTGTTDWPSLDQYYNGKSTGRKYNSNAEITGEIDLFGKNGFVNTQYTSGEQPLYEDEFEFKDSPLSKLNYGLTMGVGIELSGFNIGLAYDLGLANLANEDYWTSKRLQVSNYSTVMEDYKFKLNRFNIKIAYIFR